MNDGIIARNSFGIDLTGAFETAAFGGAKVENQPIIAVTNGFNPSGPGGVG